MKLYQAGYFRKGKQGNDAGWGIVSPSEGMSKTAKDGFQGIAANLTELKQKESMPVRNLGLFFHDRFVYLMHVNYAAAGEDARGVSFIHGYCFNLTDYYELCSAPSHLFGLREDNFQMEYDEKIKAYPVAEGFSAYVDYDFQALLKKYGFTDDEYRKLILGALCAIEGYSDSLCIKCDKQPEDYMHVYREILYLIMMGLPYHMRIRVSCFSYKGAKAAIYLSDMVKGNNYADLDAREFVCDTTRLGNYDFTRIYNAAANNVILRDGIFRVIEQFVNKSFKNPMKEACCGQVEAGFRAGLKNEDGMDAGRALELLQSFTSYSLTEDKGVYDYMTKLLHFINEGETAVLDKKTNDFLMEFYEKKEDRAFRAEMDQYYTLTILTSGEKGYKTLMDLEKKSVKQYKAVCGLIRERNPEYYQQYQEKEYLPGILTDLDKIGSYLAKEKGKLTEGECLVILDIFTSFIKRELEDANSFDRLWDLEKESGKILGRFPDGLQEKAVSTKDKVCEWIWERFDLRWFEPKKKEEYEDCGLGKVADKGYRDDVENNATLVNDMLIILKNDFEPGGGMDPFSFLFELFFTDRRTADIEEKKALKEVLRKEFLRISGWKTKKGFDVSLCLYYTYDNELFDVINWCKDCYQAKRAEDLFSPASIKGWIRRSELLDKSKWQDSFIKSLEAGVKAAKKGEGDLSREQEKSLKNYRDCLMGKEIEKKHETVEEGTSFADSWHRIFIGFMALLSIGVGLRSIYSYSSGDIRIGAFSAGIVFLAIWILIFIIKCIGSGGISGVLGNADISLDTMPKPIVYFGSIILLTGAGCAIYFLSRLSGGDLQYKIRITGVSVFAALAFISALTYLILGEE